jgi:lysophospholipase L1-like esterase
MFRPAPGVGYELRPGYRGIGQNGEAIHIDSRGYRGGGPDALRAGEARALALGDSFVFGLGVEEEETFPVALARALKGQILVENAGVPGYNLSQNAARLERALPELAPQAVILGFLENDIHNVDVPDLQAAPDGTLQRHPKAYLPEAKVNPFQALTGPWLWLQLHSAAFRLSSYALIRARLRITGDEELEALARRAERSDALADRLLRGDRDAETEPRFAAAARLLERAQASVRAAGIPLVLVIFPRPEQLVSGRLRGGSLRIAEAARRAGIAVVDPTPALAAEADRVGLYLFPNDHHPSARGYAAIAAEVARAWPAQARANASPAPTNPTPGTASLTRLPDGALCPQRGDRTRFEREEVAEDQVGVLAEQRPRAGDPPGRARRQEGDAIEDLAPAFRGFQRDEVAP